MSVTSIGNLLHRAQRLFPRRTRNGLTHVVPLGQTCRVAYQVRTHFATATAYPFDWWLTPLGGLIRYLADPDPDRVYREEKLELRVVDGWARTVVAPEFGVELFDEFPRQAAAGPVRAVAPGWQEHIAAARARHVQRLERLLSLDRPGNRVLFVRNRFDLETHDESAQEAVERLWSVLRARWAASDTWLLLVNLPPFVSPDERVLRLDFEDPPGAPPEEWRGDPARWAAGFAGLGLRPVGSPPVAGRAVGPPD